MHEKTLLEQSGVFDEFLTSHEDWDLWIRMSRITHFIHIKKVTAAFSWRTDSTSMTSRLPQTYYRNSKKIHLRYSDYVKDNPKLMQAQAKHLQRLSGHDVERNLIDCSIILPVFNRVELTQQCLTQLAKVTDGVSYEVIVVDNNSTDGTQEFLDTLDGDVQIIRNAENLGFAKACNQGAQAARGKYFIFLHNDTIPQDGWLQALVEEAETDTNIAIVGGKLLFADGTLQHAGVVISRYFLTPYHIYGGLQGNARCANYRRELQAVTAACMLIKRNWFDDVGGFDETYRNDFEDTDLCLKIGEKNGKVVYQPKSWIYHLESQSSGRKKPETGHTAFFIERWGEKFIVDEDCIAIEDRMAVLLNEKDGNVSIVYKALDDEKEYASWSKVVQLQRLLQEFGREHQSENRRESLRNEMYQLICDTEGWPKDMAVAAWIGAICYSLGIQEIGERYFLQALHVGESQKSRIMLTHFALNRGNLEEANKHLTALLEVMTDDGSVLHLQGVYFMQCKKFAEAEKSFESALHHGGNRIKAQLGIGMANVGMGQTRKAWDVFAKAADENPDHVEVINWVLRTGTELADWESLSPLLLRFLERNPINGDMRFALASVLFRLGKMEDAQAQLNTLQLLYPDFDGLEDLKDTIFSTDPHTFAVPTHG